MISQLTI